MTDLLDPVSDLLALMLDRPGTAYDPHMTPVFDAVHQMRCGLEALKADPLVLEQVHAELVRSDDPAAPVALMAISRAEKSDATTLIYDAALLVAVDAEADFDYLEAGLSGWAARPDLAAAAQRLQERLPDADDPERYGRALAAVRHAWKQAAD